MFCLLKDGRDSVPFVGRATACKELASVILQLFCMWLDGRVAATLDLQS